MSRLSITPSRQGIVEITINRPEVHNSLSIIETKALSAAFTAASLDEKVKVIVLRGEGDRSFCAGADLSDLANCKTPEERQKFFRYFAELITSIANCAKPIIASVQGLALGGGCGIVAACDISLASREAKFALPELNLGLVPMVIMAPLLRSVQRKKLAYLAYSGERFSADTASDIGLLSLVTEADQLQQATEKLALTLAERPCASLSQTKESFKIAESMDYVLSLSVLADKIGLLSSFEDTQEGIKAFLEKRAPQWKLS